MNPQGYSNQAFTGALTLASCVVTPWAYPRLHICMASSAACAYQHVSDAHEVTRVLIRCPQGRSTRGCVRVPVWTNHPDVDPEPRAVVFVIPEMAGGYIHLPITQMLGVAHAAAANAVECALVRGRSAALSEESDVTDRIAASQPCGSLQCVCPVQLPPAMRNAPFSLHSHAYMCICSI